MTESGSAAAASGDLQNIAFFVIKFPKSCHFSIYISFVIELTAFPPSAVLVELESQFQP